MWNEFQRWYILNSLQITWFIIGWLSLSAITDLVNGNYFWAFIDMFLIYANYKLRKML